LKVGSRWAVGTENDIIYSSLKYKYIEQRNNYSIEKRNMNQMLLIACIFGVLQGLMTLIGGSIAAYDSDKSLNDDLNPDIRLGRTLSPPDYKYGCGDIRGFNLPEEDELWNKEHKCKRGKMDRGWFRRVRNHCKDNEGISPSYLDICKLKGFNLVLAYAITCGIGWLISGGIAAIAAVLNIKLAALAAAGAFAAFYIISIVLFYTVWDSVRKFNKECLDKACGDVRRGGKRSANEFLGYSICSFVLIFGAIVCCVLGALSLEEDFSGAGQVKQGGLIIIIASQEPRTEERPELSTVAQEYIKKFTELNKYIADKNKMERYADKKFDETDSDKSGILDFSEFKVFVNKIMGNKGLPPPSDRKVTALVKKYDTDKSGTLEKKEFHDMLLEIFIESREILISKYAVKKAESWKPAKVPTYKDLSKVSELDRLLNNTDDFYKAFKEEAKIADENQYNKLDIDEVTSLIRNFCNKYRTPVFNRRDIIEIMNDMGRDIKEYHPTDLRMVAYATMLISRNLLK